MARHILAVLLLCVWLTPGHTFLVSSRDYVCTETTHKLITDAWSVKDQLIFIRLNHYSKKNNKEFIQRLVVYDVPSEKFLAIFRPTDRTKLAQAEVSTKLADVISVSLMNSIDDSRAPSVLFFESRIQLRRHCQQHWFYDPPGSGFCRRHSVTTTLGSVLAIVKQIYLFKPHTVDFELHKLSATWQLDSFASSNLRSVHRHSLTSIKDTLTQMISASTLLLQVNHHHLGSHSSSDVRFLFSNKLGLLFSWLPSTLDVPMPAATPNCIILLPVKMQPTIRLCSVKYSFVSVIEVEPYIYVVLPSNRVLRLSHEFLIRQFRLYNNLEIDLDAPNHRPRELFETFFRCNSYSRQLKTKDNREGLATNLTQVVGGSNLTQIVEPEMESEHRIVKRASEENVKVILNQDISCLWYYIAPIGTLLLVAISLLIVIYIVGKIDNLPQKPNSALKFKSNELNHSSRIVQYFKLNRAEVAQVKAFL